MQSIPLMSKTSSMTPRSQRAFTLHRLKSLAMAYALPARTEAQSCRQRIVAVVIAFALAAIL